jgi:lysozyme
MDKNLIALVMHYESLHDGDMKTIGLQPKMCPAGYWTEGYGSLILDENGRPFKGRAQKTEALKHSRIHEEKEAVEDLVKKLTDYGRRVDSH